MHKENDKVIKMNFTFLRGVVVLQPRLNGFILFVKESHVRDEVLDDIH